MTERKKEDMNIVIVGHVDHGKSTLMGRLLADTDSLPQGKLEQVKETCRRNSKPFEYAFLLDALKDEQAQGITIDTARCFFKTEKRDYIILDAPGHIEFLKNMITGAARAEAAILVIDADEGIQENSRRHGYMLSMLGIKQIAVAINKMDLVDYNEEVYEHVKNEYLEFLRQIHVEPTVVLPVSAFEGENIVKASKKMPWYHGSSILQVLDEFECEKSQEQQAFRMPVQDVYKFTENGDNRRIVAGTVETGRASVGDRVVFLPSGKSSTIKTIEAFHAPIRQSVAAGTATGFTLEEQIYVKRGEMMVLEREMQPLVSNRIAANVFWLGKASLVPNKNYFLKIGSEKVGVKLENVVNTMNSSSLSYEKKEFVGKNEVAECIFRTARSIAFDPVEQNAYTSRFVLIDGYEICGGGIILGAKEEEDTEAYSISTEPNIVWQNRKVTYDERCSVLGQRGLVVWFTGLSGAGKSTIAVEVEKRLNMEQRAVYLLDGDNIRHGINADLGFTDHDRNENIRRIAEVAALFQDAGMITLVSFISPFAKMRDYARERAGANNFIEVYVQADLETCAKRDPKGLYKKHIENFTGVSSPYEPPKHPELVLDTEQLSVEESVELVMNRIEHWLKK